MESQFNNKMMINDSRGAFFLIAALMVLMAGSSSSVDAKSYYDQKLQVSVPAPSPQEIGCLNLLMNNLMDCLTFTESGSTDPAPKGGCCQGLENVVNLKAMCLCEVVQDSKGMGIILNSTRVFALPAICKVEGAPSPSQCQGGSLAPSPAVAPVHPPSPSAAPPAIAPTPKGPTPVTSPPSWQPPSSTPPPPEPVTPSPTSSPPSVLPPAPHGGHSHDDTPPSSFAIRNALISTSTIGLVVVLGVLSLMPCL